MKATVNAKDFAEAAARAAKVAPKAPYAPMWAHVLVEADNGQLTIEAQNWKDLSARVTVPAAVGEPGRVWVLARSLAEATKTTPAGVVQVTADEDGLELRPDAGGRYTLDTADHGENWPELTPTVGEAVTIDTAELVAALRAVAPSASPDTARPTLHAVSLEPDGARARLVATDSYRIVVAELPKLRLPWDDRTILPLDEVKTVLAGLASHRSGKRFASAPPKRGPETCTILARTSTGGMYVGTPRGDYRVRPLEGSYPQWQQFFPKPDDVAVEATINREAMLGALKPMETAAKKTDAPVHVAIKAEGVELAYKAEGVELDATVGADIGGEPADIGGAAYNVTFLADGLRAIDDDNVRMSWTAPLKPTLIAGAHNGRVRYLLMPVRTAQ